MSSKSSDVLESIAAGIGSIFVGFVVCAVAAVVLLAVSVGGVGGCCYYKNKCQQLDAKLQEQQAPASQPAAGR